MKNTPYFPDLTEDDIRDLTAFRRELHQHPELSGEERETARRVCDKLADSAPDTVLTDVGGHGIAAIFDSGVPGPTILFRSELDALPIEELGDIPHRSTIPGKRLRAGTTGIPRSCWALAARWVGNGRRGAAWF